MEKIAKVLTADQMQKWQEMTGKAVKGNIRFGPMGPFGMPGPPR